SRMECAVSEETEPANASNQEQQEPQEQDEQNKQAAAVPAPPVPAPAAPGAAGPPPAPPAAPVVGGPGLGYNVPPAHQPSAPIPSPQTFFETRWPGPGEKGGRYVPLAVLAGALGFAVFVPLSRVGIGWFLGGLIAAAAVAVVALRSGAA